MATNNPPVHRTSTRDPRRPNRLVDHVVEDPAELPLLEPEFGNTRLHRTRKKIVDSDEELNQGEEIIALVSAISSMGSSLLSLTYSIQRLDANIANDMLQDSVSERVLRQKRNLDQITNDDFLLRTLDVDLITKGANALENEIALARKNLNRAANRQQDRQDGSAMQYWEAIGKSELDEIIQNVFDFGSTIKKSAPLSRYLADKSARPQRRRSMHSQNSSFPPPPEERLPQPDAPFIAAPTRRPQPLTSTTDLMSMFNVSLDMARAIATSRTDLPQLVVIVERLTAWISGLAEWFLDQTHNKFQLHDPSESIRDLAASDLIELLVKQDVFIATYISSKDGSSGSTLSKCQSQVREMLTMPQYEIHATSVWQDYDISAHQPDELSLVQEMQDDVERLFGILPMVSNVRQVTTLTASMNSSSKREDKASFSPPPPPVPQARSDDGEPEQARTNSVSSDERSQPRERQKAEKCQRRRCT